MTYEEWETKYKPRLNPLDEYAALSGYMLETFGLELEHVKQQPNQYVWTWVEGDGSESLEPEDEDAPAHGGYLTPGYHFVNRLGYVITEVPWVAADNVGANLVVEVY